MAQPGTREKIEGDDRAPQRDRLRAKQPQRRGMDPVERHQQSEGRREVLPEEWVGRKARGESVAMRSVPDDLVEIGEVERRALQRDPTSEGVAEEQQADRGCQPDRRYGQLDRMAPFSKPCEPRSDQDDTVTWMVCTPVAPAGAKPCATSD